jgi:hypothetical protein
MFSYIFFFIRGETVLSRHSYHVNPVKEQQTDAQVPFVDRWRRLYRAPPLP